MRVAPQELVRDAIERVVISGHEGKSGAGLERVRLADGRAVIVKRIEPGTDFTIEATGGLPGCEILLWQAGVFEHLPDGVGHALIDAWVEDDATVLVMRDLGDAMLTWNHRLDARQAMWLMQRTAALHRAYLGATPPSVVPLERALALFAPANARPLAERGIELMRLVLRGWEIFADEVPADVSEAVFALLDDVTPLRCALENGPVTMTHGDLATVNMAIEGDTLVLIDWAMPTAAPGSLDVASASPSWRAPSGSAGTRRSTRSTTRTRRPAPGSGPTWTGGSNGHGPPWKKEFSDGPQHALPPHRRGVGGSRERGGPRPVGCPDAL